MNGQTFEELILADLQQLYEKSANHEVLTKCEALFSLWPVQLIAARRSLSQQINDLKKLLQAAAEESEFDYARGGVALTGIDPPSERPRERMKRQGKCRSVS